MKISGIVVKGKGEGRILSFPTANIKADEPINLANGVYLAETVYQGKNYQSLVIIGINADFEVWLKGFSGDLYGQKLATEIGQKISEITPVDNQDDLIKKIKADVERAEKIWLIN